MESALFVEIIVDGQSHFSGKDLSRTVSYENISL